MTLQQTKDFVVAVLKKWMTNKKTIDKISESDDGDFLFDGKKIEVDVDLTDYAKKTDIPKLATTSIAGTVIPDGETITVDENGVISGASSIDKLEDIGDVELTDVTDRQALVWDNENSKWINEDVKTEISQDTRNSIIFKDDGIYSGIDSMIEATVDSKEKCVDTPVGHIMAYFGITPPSHYLACDGAEYNIADYPYLSTFIKEQFGSVNHFGGDGETTFKVPDLRGEFLRGTGENSHSKQGNGADVSVHQDGTVIPTIATGSNDFYAYGDETNWSSSTFDSIVKRGTKYVRITGTTVNTPSTVSLGSSRPTNTSVLYCIKYEPTYYVNIDNYAVTYDDYSEEEKVIGKWIDGKPIYRKVVILDNEATPVEAWTSRFELPDSEILVNVVTKTSTDNTLRTFCNLYKIHDHMFQDYKSDLFGVYDLVIVEYTKTTDEPNSFTPEMIKNRYFI